MGVCKNFLLWEAEVSLGLPYVVKPDLGKDSPEHHPSPHGCEWSFLGHGEVLPCAHLVCVRIPAGLIRTWISDLHPTMARKKAPMVALASFCGVNIPIMATFERPHDATELGKRYA